MLLFHNPGPAQALVPASTDPQHPALTKISRSAAKVETIVSDFKQEKHTAMLSDAMISTGRLFYQKPDRLRWEITHPTHFGFSINGERALLWKGEHTPAEVFQIEERPAINRFAQQLFAWIQADFSRIGNLYRIEVRTGKPVSVVLNPLAEAEKNMIARILIFFSLDSRHVETVEIREHDGDFTRIRFYNTRINVPLKKERF